jgi:endonuclease-3 related protein
MENKVNDGKVGVGSLLMAIYDALHEYYGPQSWWPSRSGSAWEVMLGAVLTQRTTWKNVELSMLNMVARWGAGSLSDPRVVLEASDGEMAEVLRPTGFFASKPRTLRNLAGYVTGNGGVDAFAKSVKSMEQIRRELLGLWGIGLETADAILLYALGRPSFVADAYALRLVSRWGLVRPNAGYEELRALFMDNLPHDAALFNEFHALIVRHGKEICRPRPLCEICPLNRPIPVGGIGTWQCPKVSV